MKGAGQRDEDRDGERRGERRGKTEGGGGEQDAGRGGAEYRADKGQQSRRA